MNMRVRNRRGTADLSCPCGDWLKHWERHTRFLAVRCGAVNCPSAPRVGAHVMSTNTFIPVTGVVPLCGRCSHREDEFDIRDPIAPAFRQSTCGCGIESPASSRPAPRPISP